MKAKRAEERARLNIGEKHEVLRDLRKLRQDCQARRETVLGRFFECQELQRCSALLASAVEQCSRWHGGRRLPVPGGALPPTN